MTSAQPVVAGGVGLVLGACVGRELAGPGQGGWVVAQDAEEVDDGRGFANSTAALPA